MIIEPDAASRSALRADDWRDRAHKQRLGHISKQGNSLLRLLVEAAQRGMIHPDWRRRYIPSDASTQGIAKVAMGRRLAVPCTGCGGMVVSIPVVRVRFVRGTARCQTWRKLERRALGWGIPLPQREGINVQERPRFQTPASKIQASVAPTV